MELKKIFKIAEKIFESSPKHTKKTETKKDLAEISNEAIDSFKAFQAVLKASNAGTENAQKLSEIKEKLRSNAYFSEDVYKKTASNLFQVLKNIEEDEK